MGITNISPDGGEITLNDGNGDCVLHISRSVSDWQQQFQQFAAYATRLNPIYGAYIFVFTVVLEVLCVSVVSLQGVGAIVRVPYQQFEMSAPAPNSSGADNTSAADGWEDGWDDEEAPARHSDKKPASSVSANGLSLRSHTNSKDGWDADWDD